MTAAEVQDRRRPVGMQQRSHQGSAGSRTVLVRGTPEAVLRLSAVTNDWMWGALSHEGRVKLLRENDLLAEPA